MDFIQVPKPAGLEAGPIVGPWGQLFDTVVTSARHDLLILSPYVTSWAADRLVKILGPAPKLAVTLVTDLSPRILLESSEPGAFRTLAAAVPTFSLRHLRGLHAKVYVADSAIALVTSGNFTRGGLETNHECGFLVNGEAQVSSVRASLAQYVKSSVATPPESVEWYLAKAALARRRKVRAPIPGDLLAAFKAATKRARQLAGLRAKFTPAILRALRDRGPTQVGPLYEVVRSEFPSLCDDTLTRGSPPRPLWQHEVRFALQEAKEQGTVKLRREPGQVQGGYWSLATPLRSLS